ncbi:polyprenyl synthetase family protein [Olivibacter sp. XZL3]|uniref:polyprenyl synthetase family protein n=1 Tax=Olivibacter sp. XZL3 TaxID=1735116 RepID=UPI001064B357|nr:polyprenyl synthetase family protein [Olivibacter sp. XZL3]
MQSIVALQRIISEALDKRTFPDNPISLYEPISYFLGIGGKRLRPVLTLLAADMFGAAIAESLPAALAVEMFHNFTLMHDDIMDEAPLRRGRETIHTKWDVNTAILSGDATLITAYQLLAECKSTQLAELLKVFNKMAQEVCEGQQLDMDFEKLPTVSEGEYLHMIRLKTSVLLGAALEMGAILGQASAQDRANIYAFGVNMGIAFQLQDDILDVYGDPLKFGKQVGGDIIENKKTYLLINALQLAKGDDKKELMQWIETTDFEQKRKIERVTAIFDKLGLQELANQKKIAFAKDAYRALDAIELAVEKKLPLIEFAQNLLTREH